MKEAEHFNMYYELNLFGMKAKLKDDPAIRRIYHMFPEK